LFGRTGCGQDQSFGTVGVVLTRVAFAFDRDLRWCGARSRRFLAFATVAHTAMAGIA